MSKERREQIRRLEQIIKEFIEEEEKAQRQEEQDCAWRNISCKPPEIELEVNPNGDIVDSWNIDTTWQVITIQKLVKKFVEFEVGNASDENDPDINAEKHCIQLSEILFKASERLKSAALKCQAALTRHGAPECESKTTTA
jgi:hypothetical protein